MTALKKYLRSILNFIKKRWKLLLIVLIILAGLGIWQVRRMANQKPDQEFVQPQIKDLTKFLEVSGVVDAKEKVNLRFAAGGKVTYLGAKEGESVRKYQTIAMIDQATLEKQLQTDLNNYLKERLDWDQTLDDTQDRTLPKSEVRTKEQEQLDLNNSVIDVEIKDIAIKNNRLTAPFAGILVASPLTVPGVNLLATDVFELVNPETLVFKAAVDEADIAQVAVGDYVNVTLDAYPDDPITTQITSIGLKSQQTSSGTVFVVEMPIPGLLTQYRLGMNGDASIEVDKKGQILVIPLDATRQRDGKTYVDVKTGPKSVSEREITTGLETDDEIEVVSGLTEQDSVVLPE